MAQTCDFYFQSGQEFLTDGSSYSLRQLIGNVQQGHARSFGPLADASTVNAYAKEMTSLLTFIAACRDRFPFSDCLQRNLTDLFQLMQRYHTREEGEEALHCLLLGLWTEAAWDMNKQVDVVTRYLCAKAMCGPFTFLAPHQVTPITARLAYWAKVSVLMAARTLIIQHDREGPPDLAHLLDLLREHRFTVFSSLRNVMHLAFAASGSVVAQPAMDWVPGSNYTALLLHREEVTITLLQGAYATLLAAAAATLSDDLLLGLPVRVNVADLHLDVLDSTASGYSFLSEPTNHLSCHKLELFRHMQHRATRPGTGEWDVASLRRWQRREEAFLRALFTLTHLCGGAPARATELAHIALSNAPGVRRGVFFMLGTLALVSTSTKSRSSSSQEQAAARFLPHEVASLLLTYLAAVRPFSIYLSSTLPGPPNAAAAAKTWLWVENGDQVSSSTLSRWWKEEFARATGKSIMFAEMRHVLIAFLDKLVLPHLQGRTHMGNVLDLQAGHTTSTAAVHYGRTAGESLHGLDRDMR